MRRKINKLIEELEKLWNMSLYLMEGETLQQLYDNLQDKLLYEKGLLKGDKR